MAQSVTDNEPLGLKFYRKASQAAGPLAELALKRRLKAGKEDPLRINERRGVAGKTRPDGPLIWIHGASVGESLSVLPLVRRLRQSQGNLRFLVTTGTITSARLMAERLPDGAIHQFIPLDHPRYVDAFLDYWKPDAAIFVESEFWPNLILKAREKVRFMALVNGRVSPKSFEEWNRKKGSIKFILSAFDMIIAQDRKNAERLEILSNRPVRSFGNLKNAAPALPVDQEELDAFREQIGSRLVWLAASTHPGEEEAIFDTHANLKKDHPTLLTLLAPRHPERGEEVRDLALQSGLIADLRSNKQQIRAETEVYVADTLGELGLFYRLSDVSFVGGSLTPKGGHNPLEPARLGGSILHGPYTFNFVETYEEMRSAGGAALVRNERELATAIRRLLADDKTRRAMANAAQAAAEVSAEKVLTEISDLILTKLEKGAVTA